MEIQSDNGQVNKTVIIAEAGVNHNGSLELAKKLIDVASEAGVDYVKFQTFKADKLVTRSAKKASYQAINMEEIDDSQFNMLKKLELDHESHIELISYSAKKNIQFLSTPFDLESIEELKNLGIKIGKIPSGEITNLPYLRKMANNFSEIILSTGMSTLDEIEDAIQIINQEGVSNNNITVLHCNTEYPTPFKDVHLLAMQTIGKAFDVKIGYSDHTLGIEVSIAAVALGANVIEKHFTLDRHMDGPDHKASLEPDELKNMVSAIRNIEKALGLSVKQPSPSEINNRIPARKSIVANCNILSGEVFSGENITTKRPGLGISPMRWDEIIGKTAKRNFDKDDLIEV
jgi:N,N'-diacetyllegionaminate synthase